jgi:hypothetical protein
VTQSCLTAPWTHSCLCATRGNREMRTETARRSQNTHTTSICLTHNQIIKYPETYLVAGLHHRGGGPQAPQGTCGPVMMCNWRGTRCNQRDRHLNLDCGNAHNADAGLQDRGRGTRVPGATRQEVKPAATHWATQAACRELLLLLLLLLHPMG